MSKPTVWYTVMTAPDYSSGMNLSGPSGETTALIQGKYEMYTRGIREAFLFRSTDEGRSWKLVKPLVFRATTQDGGTRTIT